MSNPHFTMPNVRVVVADASKARYFRVDSPTGELIELAEDVNPEGRMYSRELVSDSRGEQTSHAKDSRSVVDEASDPKEVEIQRFARSITDKLDKERAEGSLEKLYVVAPPKFLGELRHQMKPALKSVVVEEINKDLASMDARELRKQLPERLK